MLKRLPLTSKSCLYISFFCFSWSLHAAEKHFAEVMDCSSHSSDPGSLGSGSPEESSAETLPRAQNQDPQQLTKLSKIRKKIKKYELAPLVDVDWSYRHPQQLPYGECLLTNTSGNWTEASEEGIIYSAGIRGNDPYTLFCYNKTTKSAYMIPISIVHDHSIGLNLNFTGVTFRARLAPKKGARLSGLFGSYSGLSGGLGYFLTLGGASLANDYGNRLNINTCMGLGGKVSFTYRSLKISQRRLTEREIYSQEYLEQLRGVSSKLNIIMENFDDNNPGCLDLAKHQQEKLESLHAWSAERKYNPMARYWVHHLSREAAQKDADTLLSSSLPQDLLNDFQFINVQ